MFTFLRRIRKALLDSSQIRRYTFYALGEIALVVLGILIALQINNLNEIRKNQREESLILNGLVDEFQENKKRIQVSLKANENTVSAAYEIIALIRSGEVLHESEKMDSLITRMVLFSSFDASTGVVDEIINSGKLPIISDRTLRTRLTRWSSLLEEVIEDRRIRLNNYTGLIVPHLIQYFPIANGENYLDFSTWSKTFKINKKEKSPFKSKLTSDDLMTLENVVWQFKYDNDFIILNEKELEAFIKETLELVQSNLGN